MSKQVGLTTHNITDVVSTVLQVSDSVRDTYLETKDLKAAMVAIKGYSVVVSAASAQMQYKKATGTPGRIAFLEGNVDISASAAKIAKKAKRISMPATNKPTKKVA